MNERIDILTSAVERLTRIVTVALLNKLDTSSAVLTEDDRTWANDRAAEADRDAQWRREAEERNAQARQDEINSNHPIEQILGPGESVRISYTGCGRTTGIGAFPMSNFNGFAEVPAGYSLRTSIAKMFREVPAIESVTITATIPTMDDGEVPVTVDAHARENRQVAVFSSDGVYKALISVDELVEDEIPY